MARYDLVIRSGTIVDGSGAEPYQGDVAVAGGMIADTGTVKGAGTEEIDAKGMLVTPGFIDVHTHYDGQVTWSDELSPGSQHGVTTVLMGNCGVGFAPCRHGERKMLLDLMEGIEDIPESVMEKGIPWTWETFPELMAFLAKRRYDVDFGVMLPHAPVRIYAMGVRGKDRGPASGQDVAYMAGIVKEAMAAGAFGFSTTRSVNNRSKDGSLAPTINAREDELLAMASAMREFGGGILQINDQWMDMTPEGSAEFEIVKKAVKASGGAATFAVLQQDTEGDKWQLILDFVAKANAENITMRPQICTRPIGVFCGWDVSLNPFMFCPSWKRIENLPLAQKMRMLSDPVLRAALLAEEPVTTNPLTLWLARTVENMTEFADPPDYAPPASAFLNERAKREGKTPLELAYDLMMKRDGANLLYHPCVNFSKRNLDHVPTMLRSRNAIIGLGDGGAHVGIICDASLPTHLLSYWTRDRTGERLSVPEAVNVLTRRNAEFMCLPDRGLVKRGLRADLNVIDYDRMRLYAPRPVYDLPSGARRLMQRADGYVATIKAGQITYREGKATGLKPGRLIKRGQLALAA